MNNFATSTEQADDDLSALRSMFKRQHQAMIAMRRELRMWAFITWLSLIGLLFFAFVSAVLVLG